MKVWRGPARPRKLVWVGHTCPTFLILVWGTAAKACPERVRRAATEYSRGCKPSVVQEIRAKPQRSEGKDPHANLSLSYVREYCYEDPARGIGVCVRGNSA